MAKLPGYDAKVGMTTESPIVQRDVAVETQGARNLQMLGKVAQDVAQVWQDAKDFDDTLREKNRIDVTMADIVRRANEDPSIDNLDEYHTELNEAKSAVGGFSNDIARRQFQQYANNAVNQAAIKVEGTYRKKVIDNGRANLLTQEGISKGKYVSGDPQALADYKGLIQEAFNRGFITEQEAAKKVVDTGKWDYDRALADAQNGTLRPLDEYDIEVGKKDDLVREIKQIAEIKTKQDEIAILGMQQENQKRFLEDQQAGMSIEESLRRLDYGMNTNTMNKKWAETRRAAVLSSAGVDPEMQVDYYYGVVQKINRASAEYNIKGSGKSAKNYIREANDALIMINEGLATGKLDATDEAELLKRIYTKDLAEAEQDAGRKLRDATKYFENTLTAPDVPYAVKAYVEETTGKKRAPDNDKLTETITNKIQAASRNEALRVKEQQRQVEQVETQETRVINGATYIKVEGGWQKQ